MIIYRIEHLSDGTGPYSRDSLSDEDSAKVYDIIWNNWSEFDQPCPYEDGIFSSFDETDRHKHYRYAFGCLEDLFNWFDIDKVIALLAFDYVIAEYSVNAGHVRMGRKHLAYNANGAETLALYDTLDFMADHPVY